MSDQKLKFKKTIRAATADVEKSVARILEMVGQLSEAAAELKEIKDDFRPKLSGTDAQKIAEKVGAEFSSAHQLADHLVALKASEKESKGARVGSALAHIPGLSIDKLAELAGKGDYAGLMVQLEQELKKAGAS